MRTLVTIILVAAVTGLAACRGTGNGADTTLLPGDSVMPTPLPEAPLGMPGTGATTGSTAAAASTRPRDTASARTKRKATLPQAY
jgi:hypothetical protein